MKHRHTIFIGKAVKRLARLRGGGSALPGLIVERLDKHFLARTLHQLPQGVVLITGTNGKTTTTKIVVELLKQSGLKVFTNRTGSNFTRGIIAALLGVMDQHGKLDYDMAVLELDEAYAVHFTKQVHPDYVLVLNVMRDQLDRFGEIDHTAKLLEQVAKTATKGVVLNRDDPRVAQIARRLDSSTAIHYFGANTKLHRLFVSDDDLHTAATIQANTAADHPSDVTLLSFKGQAAQYQVGSEQYTVQLQLRGVYNFLNAAGALALTHMILGEKSNTRQLVEALVHVSPAFGRGEVITIQGRQLELILVKNPSGFRLALASHDPTSAAIMIAINDLYADGRDMSWLWDVDFSALAPVGVSMVSGIRTYDMALRLQYDNVPIGATEPQLGAALKQFITSTKDQPMRVFCTYTAMLALRRRLKKYATVEHIS